MTQGDAQQPVPVAIIGMGCLFPMAADLERFWANIRGKVDAITEIPPSHWRPEEYWSEDPKAPDRTYARRGGFLTPVDFPLLDFGIAPHAVEATDTSQLLGLLVARQALEDAGYGPGREFNRDRVSVILGVTGTLELVIPLGARLGHPIWRRALREAGVEDWVAEDVVARISDSYVGWQENSFPGLLGNVAAGRIANRLDLGGTNCVVDAACASSLGAVNVALLELAAGRCDVAVSGGIDTFNDIFMYMCFSKTPALSPSGDARPFDAGSDGTILGEGVGLLVLKRLEDARRDGDRIYAVIRSMGTSSDGKGQAVYAPSASGQVKAIREAYGLAGVEPSSIELVEAHGTGTRVGDAIELEALERVYRGARDQARWCALGSIKSQVGHTKAAAGAAGLIKAALALHRKVLPPTIKVHDPIDSLKDKQSPFAVSTEIRPWLAAPGSPRRAAVSAFGFGGSNFHCVLEEASPEMAGIDWGGDVQILAYSGANPQGVSAMLPRWSESTTWDEVRREGSRSRRAFRADDPVRLLVVADRRDADLPRLIERAVGRLRDALDDRANSGRATEPRRGNDLDTVLMGIGPARGPLAVLFPGQGSQYVGMLRDLACRFPAVHDALRRWNEAAGHPLSDRIYPPPTFAEDIRLAQEVALRETRVAQPAIGAISLGLFRILQDFGLRPDVVAGHSFGELTALWAAGRIDEASLIRLSLLRGSLMGECGRGQDAGAMLALFAPAEDALRVIEEHALDVVIANRNAPRQIVLSGPKPEIERAAALFSAAGLTSRALPVSAAFHSRLVAGAESEFRQNLEDLTFPLASTPVYANATGDPYPEAAPPCRDLLAGQLARPVEFVSMIEAMYTQGARTFLEVGPDARLTGLVRSILEGREFDALAVDDPRGRGDASDLRNLARTLATLAALGHPIRLEKWDEGYAAHEPAAPRKAFTVKVCGANPSPPPQARPSTAARAEAPASATRDVSTNGSTPHVSHRLREVEPIGPSQSRDPLPERIMNPPKPDAHQPTNGHASTARPLMNSHALNGTRISPEPPPMREVASSQATHALQQAQENLIALQRLAEQTAQLHRQFLEGQAETQRTLQALLERQFAVTDSVPAMVPVHEPLPLAARPVDRPLPTSTIPPELQRTEPVPRPEPVAVASRTPEPTPAIPSGAAAVLVEVVAEKTGYPAEMLELDMQLDADLGIDSIKRVEILSAIQDRLPHAPAVGPDQVGTLRTLRQIAEFLDQGAPPDAVTPTTVANGRHRDDDPAPRNAPGAAAVLVEVVAEKTGYPAEMLELDMQLDADLGIDSIKRVEILSAIQDRLPHAPAVGPDQVGTLRTLRQIAEFLDQGAPHAVAPTPGANGRRGDDAPAPAPSYAPAAAVLVEVVAEKTGYPAEMLELDMQLDADLGIDSIKRVEILSAIQDRLPHAPAVGPDQVGTLRTLRQIAEFLDSKSSPGPSVPAEATTSPHPAPAPIVSSNGHSREVLEPEVPLNCLAPVAASLADGGHRERLTLRHGARLWLAAGQATVADALKSRLEGLGHRVDLLSPTASGLPQAPEDLSGLIVVAPTEFSDAGDRFLKWAFAVMRGAGSSLRRSGNGGGSLLMSISALDGRFGLAGGAVDARPAAGALAGLIKTAHHEWPEVSCKAVDLDPSMAPDVAAERVVREAFLQGPLEVGVDADGSYGIELAPVSHETRSHTGGVSLDPGDLILISGGARGVTAEVAVALASWARPRLVLLGRTPTPAEEPEWLTAHRTEAAIRRAIGQHAGKKLTPQGVQEQARLVLHQREIRRNLERIRAEGAEVTYHAIDVRDAAAVRELVGRLRRDKGPVRGLVHGAGVLADRRIEDQTDEQFAAVLDTKVHGLNSLFEAVDPRELRFVALFSSSTARFGRSGQVAYAGANEYLNKWAQAQSRRLPDCRVVAFNWGPWDGGMVTPELKTMFSREGLGTIPLDAGARLLTGELQQPRPRPVEIVVLADAARTSSPADANPASSPANGQHVSTAKLDLAFERLVDLKSLPVLRSHVIDGHAVLPMALILEWLAEGALHRHPGMSIHGVDRLQLFKGIVLKDHRPAPVSIRVGRHERRDGALVVPVELHGSTHGGRALTHARADVLLVDRPKEGQSRLASGPVDDFPHSLEEIYRKILFHGPDMQAIRRVERCDERTVVAWVSTSPPPSDWMEKPTRQNWLTDPLAIDAAFQAVVLWTKEQRGSNSLPTAVGSYRQFRRSFPAGGVRVVAEVRQAGEHRAIADLEFLDLQGQIVASIEGYECVIDASLNQAFRRNRLSQLEVAAS